MAAKNTAAAANNDPFSTPAVAAAITWENYNGSLMLITPHELVQDIDTEFGPKDAIRADFVILHDDGEAEVMDDAMIFPKMVQSQVRRNIGTGKAVLGRLEQGEKKKGNAPWQLAEPTDDDKNHARTYFAG